MKIELNLTDAKGLAKALALLVGLGLAPQAPALLAQLRRQVAEHDEAIKDLQR